MKLGDQSPRTAHDGLILKAGREIELTDGEEDGETKLRKQTIYV